MDKAYLDERSSDSPVDPQPWHLNEAIARSTFFKELVASGWHTTALTMQLIIQTLPLSEGIIGSGVDELRWPRPVRPGDALRLHCEIIEVQELMLHPSRGTVRVRINRCKPWSPICWHFAGPAKQRAR